MAKIPEKEPEEVVEYMLKTSPPRMAGTIVETAMETVAGELEKRGGPAKIVAYLLKTSPAHILSKSLTAVSGKVAEEMKERVKEIKHRRGIKHE